MSKIGFSSNPSNGASHTWRSRRRFNYSSSKGGWQAKGAVPPAPSAPTLNNNTDLQDMNDATGLAAKMRGMAVMYNSYSDFPTEAYTGSFAYARDTNELYVWTGANPVPPVIPWYGDRALSFGGNENTLEYFSITTAGTSANFGNMLRTGASNMENGVGDGTYGLLGVNGHISACSTIDYVTIASTSDAASFGNLSVVRSGTAACSDGTYGVWGGGEQISGSYSRLNTIDYITIQTGGTAQNFGNLLVNKYLMGSLSDGTYGVWGGGRSSSNVDLNTMEYVTVATTSNASSFGNLSIARRYASGIGGQTYGYFANFYVWPPSNNSIDYITTATPSNATDFGDLLFPNYNASGTGNDTYGVFVGGYDSAVSNVIQRFTQDTSSNCSDFGDLLVANNNHGTVSGNAA